MPHTPSMPPSSSLSDADFALFRPVRGRRVALAVAAVTVLVFAVVAFALPTLAGGVQWETSDRVMLFLIGLAIAAFAHRYASIRAVPTPEGLRVRNLILTRQLGWAEIVGIRLSPGDPWVSLDLSDTDNLAVMAIQAADGEFAHQEAQRLARLVVLHGGPEGDVND